MQENWKRSESWPRYEVSDQGNVRIFTSKRLLKQENHSGYKRITLTEKGYRKKFLVHRLIIGEFIGYSHLDVNHKDENKSNNTLLNLEYASKSENVNHSLHKWCRDFEVRNPEGVVFTGTNLKEFCSQFDLHQGHMNDVCLGKIKQYKGWTCTKINN